MKGLAAFVMRGRVQASGAAAIASALPLVSWIGAAIVALIVLRQGLKEGALVSLWAALPLIVAFQVGGDSSGLIALAGTVVIAVTLRLTGSWELTLYACVVASGVGSLLFSVISESILITFVEWYVGMVEQLAVEQNLNPVSVDEGRRQAVSFLAMGQAYLMVGALMLSRWWQSVLFNPGGFGQELKQTRLSLKAVVPIVSVGLLLAVQDGMGSWLGLLTVPFVVIGAGLVHEILAARGVSHQWYVMFYVTLLLFFQAVCAALVVLVTVDSAMDIRQRMRSKED